MCRIILDTIASAKDSRRTFLPLPILVTQICKEWILEDEFNDAMQDIVKIVHETVSSSHQASLQIDWTTDILWEHVNVTSSSSNESKDEDNEFFDQEQHEDSRAFKKLIWERIKKTYKMIKEKKKKDDDEPHIRSMWMVVVVEAKEGGIHDGGY